MGDLSYHYKLHKKDLSDATKIEEIKQSIVNLKLSVNSYVIIDLPPKKSFPYLVFFQTARKRSFKHTNYYVLRYGSISLLRTAYRKKCTEPIISEKKMFYKRSKKFAYNKPNPIFPKWKT